jgi:CRP-like cAMP-binding protein
MLTTATCISQLWGYLASILCGNVIYALFLASLTRTIAESDQSGQQYRSKLNMVNEYMKNAQLPKSLRARLRAYYELWYPSHRSFDESHILGELSKPLRGQVALHSCRAVLEALQLLSTGMGDRAKGLPEAISLNLSRVVFVAGDFIIREGEDSEGMFFVSNGYAEVLNPDESVLTVLGRGSFFGEMALLQPGGRPVASIRVSSFCEGFFLSREAFARLIALYPSFREYLESVAKMRRVETIRRRSVVLDASEISNAVQHAKPGTTIV